MVVTPSSPGSITPPLLARLMLAAHHPVISNVRRQPQAAWTMVKRKIHKLTDLMDGESAADATQCCVCVACFRLFIPCLHTMLLRVFGMGMLAQCTHREPEASSFAPILSANFLLC